MIVRAWIVIVMASLSVPSLDASEPAKRGVQPVHPANNLGADAERKGAMSPEEAAWEKILEENLGGFYLPAYKKDKLAGKTTAWDFVKDDPKLPRVLLIGDSISRGYTQVVRRELAGRANVHRAPANCGPTEMGLKKLPVWLGDGKWDLVHFNFGIHDRKKDEETYASNLEALVDRLRPTGAKLVWARTTPPADGRNEEGYTTEQCDRLNRVADGIMRSHGIALNDLHSLIGPKLAEMQLPANVHFNNNGYELLGRQVAARILAALAEPIAPKMEGSP